MKKTMIAVILSVIFLMTLFSGCVSQDDYDTLKNEYREYVMTHPYRNPREFNSLQELNSWLYMNDVNTNTYVEDGYDCEDFAMDLVDDAREDGFLIYSMGCGYPTYDFIREYLYCDGYSCHWHWVMVIVDFYNHAFCVTKINNVWYKIEPQSDLVTCLGYEF